MTDENSVQTAAPATESAKAPVATIDSLGKHEGSETRTDAGALVAQATENASTRPSASHRPSVTDATPVTRARA